MSTPSKSDELQPNANLPADEQMQDLRDLLFGKDGQHVKKHVQTHAREVVGNVVIEALNDRQKIDDGLSQVLQPTVEKSVEASIRNNSDQFVGHLYPLVGRLVRKSATSFFSEFLEKTNELIENSLTPKGIGWRINAWRAGVSFSQYIATKTFVFRVVQVLLIHRQTGILLQSVANEDHQGADADLVSGMLTAINDFVSDSFANTNEDSEQNLNVIKTEDFSIVIKGGPQLMLVAAVTGNFPQDIANNFQITNEKIHSLYNKEIVEFDGDTLPFETTEPLLKNCLLAEAVEEEEKKRPVLALVVLFIVIVLGSWYGFKQYQQSRLSDLLMTLNQQPGILVTKVESSGLSKVKVELLRDPQSQTIESWLEKNNISAENVSILERQYLSLEPQIVQARLEKAVANFPSLNLVWQDGIAKIEGVLPNSKRLDLSNELKAIAGLNDVAGILESVEVEELNTLADDSPEILNVLLEISTAKIESTQIEFEQGASSLTDEAKKQLEALASYMNSVIALSIKLDVNVGLIVMGASDSSGSTQFNQALSRKRAQVAQQYLISFGIDPGYLNAIGLGVVEIKATGASARKVIFNIVKFKAE